MTNTAKHTRSDTKRVALLKAQQREAWDKPTTYSELFVLPSGKKHDSGWALMVLVGVKKDGSLERAAWCDDICWDVQGVDEYRMRTDCTYPSGILHFWGSTYTVGASLSSTTVMVRPIKKVLP